VPANSTASASSADRDFMRRIFSVFGSGDGASRQEARLVVFEDAGPKVAYPSRHHTGA